MNLKTLSLVVLLAGSFAFIGDGWAEESELSISLVPYYWSNSLEVTNSENGITVPIDLDEGEYRDVIDKGATFVIEAHKDKWILSLETAYVDLSGIETNAKTIIGDVPASINSQLLLVEFLGGHQFSSERHALDLMAGVRHANLNAEAESMLGTIKQKTVWNDPVLSAKYTFNATKKISIILKNNISDPLDLNERAYDRYAGAKYKVGEKFSLEGGYRDLEIKYDDGSKYITEKFKGPVISFRLKVK